MSARICLDAKPANDLKYVFPYQKTERVRGPSGSIQIVKSGPVLWAASFNGCCVYRGYKSLESSKAGVIRLTRRRFAEAIAALDDTPSAPSTTEPSR